MHVGATAFLGVDVQASGYYQDGRLRAGALVVGIVPGSPAERAGLVDGDVLTSLGGRQIASAEALTRLVLRNPPGTKVKLGWVDEAGNAATATVALASGPPQ